MARRQQEEVAEVLRAVWSARDPDAAPPAVDDGGRRKCKRLQDVGFDGMHEPGEDLHAAWRDRLDREGELDHRRGASVRDLVFGEPDCHDADRSR